LTKIHNIRRADLDRSDKDAGLNKLLIGWSSHICFQLADGPIWIKPPFLTKSKLSVAIYYSELTLLWLGHSNFKLISFFFSNSRGFKLINNQFSPSLLSSERVMDFLSLRGTRQWSSSCDKRTKLNRRSTSACFISNPQSKALTTIRLS